jgi:hypothetical protein
MFSSQGKQSFLPTLQCLDPEYEMKRPVLNGLNSGASYNEEMKTIQSQFHQK